MSSKPKSKKAPEPAQERFVNDLLTRGEAQKLEDGKLPLDATHAVTEEKDGEVKVKRARFKLF